MKIRPVRTQSDYEAALRRVEALMDARAGTPEGDELDILGTLVEAWEEKNIPIDSPDPVEFIRNTLEFRGEDQSSLAALLHSRPRASEILNRKRKLTISQIRIITSAWNVPADALIGDYDLA